MTKMASPVVFTNKLDELPIAPPGLDIFFDVPAPLDTPPFAPAPGVRQEEARVASQQAS